MDVSCDRGEIIHAAGRRRLSPALVAGSPALVRAGEPGARCGWAEFFAVLESRRLAVAFEPGDGGAVSLVPRGDARVPRPSAAARVRAAFAEARRFLEALRGHPPPS